MIAYGVATSVHNAPTRVRITPTAIFIGLLPPNVEDVPRR
jgi:hypothetical protein